MATEKQSRPTAPTPKEAPAQNGGRQNRVEPQRVPPGLSLPLPLDSETSAKADAIRAY